MGKRGPPCSNGERSERTHKSIYNDSFINIPMRDVKLALNSPYYTNYVGMLGFCLM